ncbi:MAG: DUF1905 domain-containing protein [Lachnospiraceae bacterium]|nr:DUF1905 domain-containing protein [Lachnospiraceae bacterium]
MKYTFNGIIDSTESGYVVNIPFNVWEIFDREGHMPAKVRIDGETFVCNLVPKGKGYYGIPVTKELVNSLPKSEQHKVTFRITKSEVEDSPYSTANPIRKIDSIDCIKQPADGLCGQSCIAMLAGITIDEASNIMHCAEWQATMGKMINALNYFGFEHSEEIIYTLGDPDVTLPKCCIMMEKLGRYNHYLIGFDGKFYDSGLGVLSEYDFSKLTGYLEVCI